MKTQGIFDLTGKVAIVTGGYGYLGTAMVKALSEFGAIVYVGARSRFKYGDWLESEELSSDYIKFVELDISDSKSFKNAYKTVFDQEGRLDIIINNAFISAGNQPESLSDEDWSSTLEGSLASVHKSIRESIPYLRLAGGGKIINVSSMYGIVSPDFEVYQGEGCEQFTNPPHYGAAKAAIIQLTRYYANYLGADNIQVNTLTPGPFPSPSVQSKNDVFIERLAQKTSVGRIGVPEDLSGAVILLASRASAFITGQNIIVDGGWTSM